MDSKQLICPTVSRSDDMISNNQGVRERYKCKSCKNIFTRKDNLKRHNKYVQCQKLQNTNSFIETNNQIESTNEKTYYIEDVVAKFEDDEDLNYICPILCFMNQPQEIMKWDKNSGEIFYLNNRISGANIFNLLTCTLTGNMDVVGLVQFCKGLNILSVPTHNLKSFKIKRFSKILNEDYKL